MASLKTISSIKGSLKCNFLKLASQKPELITQMPNINLLKTVANLST